MQSLVNAIAFPAPRLPRSFYNETLLARDDLVYLRTSANERIPAVYVRAALNGRNGRGFTILYAHGNAEDIGLHVSFVEAMSKLTGADVLSFEYVGYSLSRFEGGKASEDAAYRSIDAGWRYLTESRKIPPSRIVVYGRSIGTGPAVDLCARKNYHTLSTREVSSKIFFKADEGARGLFLQSPLESGVRCAFGYVSSVVLGSVDIFRNYEKIDRVECPVAVVHGTNDSVVPCAGAKNLLDQAKKREEKTNKPSFVRERWLDGYGHNDMPYDQVFNFLHDFLKDIGGPPP
mmetsp:Transcript_1782/g.5995  ORF Transcript_1782/g.5995 Transcript_1782/m.5995 type:complete len:289 (+) Transcript_1782:117-983(+)